MTGGKGAVRDGLLGAVVSIFAGPLVGVTVAGGAVGAAYGALRDKGVSDKLMKLAGKAAGRHWRDRARPSDAPERVQDSRTLSQGRPDSLPVSTGEAP